ncbi:MAG: hypothetical protein GY752_00390 [bacterium]|nr:hypothetical protein [bacterium]
MKNRPKFAIVRSAVVASCILFMAPVSAETFNQVKATWTGDGKEPSIKEFADIGCTSKGLTSAMDFDPNPSSGAYEEDGKIVSYMDFAKLDCK